MSIVTKTLINSYRDLKSNEPIDLSILQILETQSPKTHVPSYKNVLLNSCPTLFFNQESMCYTFNDRITYVGYEQNKNRNVYCRSVLNVKSDLEKNINDSMSIDTNIQNKFIEILTGRSMMVLKSVKNKSVEENSDTVEYTKIFDSDMELIKNIESSLILETKENDVSSMINLHTGVENNIYYNVNKRIPEDKSFGAQLVFNRKPEQKYVFSKNYISNVIIPIRSEGVSKVILPTTPIEESQPPIVITGNLLKTVYLNINTNCFFSITLESDSPIVTIGNLPKHVQYYQPTTTLSGYLYNQKEHEMRVFFDNGESMVLVLKTDGITKHLI